MRVAVCFFGVLFGAINLVGHSLAQEPSKALGKNALNNLCIANFDNGDYEKAAKSCRESAERGAAVAQFNFGWMYEMGHGVKQDYKKAVKWYLKAADQGHVQAWTRLGFLYGLGEGAVTDAQAVKLFRRGAELGDAQSQFLLAHMYNDGQGVPKNVGEALKWYLKAAEQGYAGAQFRLGMMYSKGKVVPKDYVVAHMWANLAASADGEILDDDGGFAVVPQEVAKSIRDLIATNMTPEQIAEAERRAREWKPNIPKQE